MTSPISDKSKDVYNVSLGNDEIPEQDSVYSPFFLLIPEILHYIGEWIATGETSMKAAGHLVTWSQVCKMTNASAHHAEARKIIEQARFEDEALQDEAIQILWDYVSPELAFNNEPFETLPQIKTSFENPNNAEKLQSYKLLNLSTLKLRAIHSQITKLTNLEIILLNNNEISIIPNFIKNLTHLTKINLAFNQISNLPDAVCLLPNLQFLDLSENKISIIPPTIGNLTQLQELVLGNNRISQLPSELGNLTQLQELHISDNFLSAIPESFEFLQQLTVLNICSNHFLAPIDFLSKISNLEIYEDNNLYNPTQFEEITDSEASLGDDSESIWDRLDIADRALLSDQEDNICNKRLREAEEEEISPQPTKRQKT